MKVWQSYIKLKIKNAELRIKSTPPPPAKQGGIRKANK